MDLWLELFKRMGNWMWEMLMIEMTIDFVWILKEDWGRYREKGGMVG